MRLTNKQIAALSQEERHAWLDGMTPDEKMVVYFPVGYRFDFIMASHIKRTLEICQMSAGERLQFLEGLNSMINQNFTEEVLAAIKPASNTALQIIHEAMALDDDEPAHRQLPSGETVPCMTMRKSFDLLTSEQVFWRFIDLDPTLLEVIKLFNRNHSGVSALH